MKIQKNGLRTVFMSVKKMLSSNYGLQACPPPHPNIGLGPHTNLGRVGIDMKTLLRLWSITSNKMISNYICSRRQKRRCLLQNRKYVYYLCKKRVKLPDLIARFLGLLSARVRVHAICLGLEFVTPWARVCDILKNTKSAVGTFIRSVSVIWKFETISC